MTEQAKVPAIRFAGFTDPWEQRKLGEIVSIGAGAPPSAFSAGNFLYVKVDDLNESSHFQFDSAQRVDANTAVKPIRKGSIIFAKRGAAILGNKVRVLGKTAYIDTNMMALEPRGVDADFLWLFINQTGLYRIADTSTIPQINNKHIEPYPVDIPNMAEQQAIGTFFSRLDDLITLHQRKYDKLVVFKKSMLEKMFPKDGESVPEIRFAGFTDPWEQRKFGDVADIKTGPFGTLLHAEDYVDDGIPIVTTEHFKTGALPKDKEGIPQVSEEDAKRLEQYRAKEGDILFSRVGSVDANAQVFAGQDGWLFSGRVLRARPDLTLVSSAYLHYELETEEVKSSVISRAVGGTMASINTEILFQTPIFIPAKMTEQNKIGSTCARLDSLITLHQRKLELLRNIKKSLLDKMFA